MNYTTADYLESLQNDLDTIVNTLGLEEGTNFSNIAEMTTQGEISKGGGVDLSDYFNDTISNGTSSLPGWKNTVKNLPDNMKIATASCSYMFSGYTGTTIPKLTVADGITIKSCDYMFNSCRNATEFDLSSIDLSNVTDVASMFYYCNKATKIDIRTFDNANVTSSQNMMRYIPDNCLVIVKDDTVKTWLKNKFISLNNVKTVEEYENS